MLESPNMHPFVEGVWGEWTAQYWTGRGTWGFWGP